MRIVAIALAIASLTAPLSSQAMARGNKQHAAEQKTAEPKNKADEKGYKSALDRLPTQKYDPWGPVRPPDAKK
jgi:hypothetical protein